MNVVHIVGNGFDISAGLCTGADILIDEFCRIVDQGKNVPTPVKDLADTIRTEGLKYWSDFERALGEYSLNEKVIDDPRALLISKSAFEAVLRECLIARNNLIDESFVEANASNCLKSLKSIFTGLEPGERRQRLEIQKNLSNPNSFYHHITTLNYTQTLQLMCDRIGYPSTLFNGNPHGTHILQSFSYAHSSLDGMPVCGVDNPSQIANETFRSDVDILATFVKSEIQSDSGKIEDRAVFDLIHQADVFCVHCAAFGETDARWWQAIRDRMLNCPHVILVISSYSYKGNYHIPYDRRIARDEAINKFLDRCGADGERRKNLAKRSFVLPSKTLFTISKPIEFEGLSDEAVAEIAERQFPEKR